MKKSTQSCINGDLEVPNCPKCKKPTRLFSLPRNGIYFYDCGRCNWSSQNFPMDEKTREATVWVFPD